MKALLGKTALVTGVGRRKGIGYAICEALAEQGASIFYTYWRKYDQERKLEGSEEDPASFASDFSRCGAGAAVQRECDLSAFDAQELFADVVDSVGTPDFLINNACISVNAGLLDVDAALLDAHYAVNIKAPTLLCGEFVRHFHKSTGGKIVNMSSGQALGVMADELPYTITKASLEMLALQLAFALREKGITINAVDPGPTDTGWITNDMRMQLQKEGVMGKIHSPQDAAALVMSFICGEREAVTGTVLHAER